MICGLLGRKLSHSYSPQIHEYLGDYSYELWEKEPEQLCDFLRSGDFTGLNVTIPYKKDVIPFCDKLTDTAKKLGAVNTIVRQSNGSLIGHNTDYFGFSSMVLRSGLAIEGKKVLVLGSGGASNTVLAVLQEMGAKAVVISRSGEDNYTNLHRHADASVIVNATPVGMYPHTGDSPVCLDSFPLLEGVLDLIAQAKEAAEWFLHRAISDSCIESICQSMRKKMENVVLIGMPGCGKSTISKLLAGQTGRIAVDADEEIIRHPVRRHGR